jgi:hypothetical protein
VLKLVAGLSATKAAGYYTYVMTEKQSNVQIAIGMCYTASPQLAAHKNGDNDCPGKTFCLVETNPDGKSGVAACSLCGFLVGVIDDGVAPRFDELIDTSSTRPFVVRLRFVKGATELRRVNYAFVSLSDAEKFSQAIEKRFGAEISANGATGFDMQMSKDGVQLGQTKVFVK